ncbi:hypothetical protein HBI56_088040 [Parastagonospora nodorum]|uniref:Uncharacterized protein n=1 Tax=Phaeosphaeria nodorum (strain SN15 / ATCC MYA-4574 / FGSC 10173) TaxID=321614 RepID=A0A7U2I815_PHANO|nr:hypothetical protein HBH56_111430 [Parastagonospora nodorum]QRD03423.1 hypothetical protein JI435_419520 [Parastagonospora nodorum SN15]KAH3925532.1 hypothetical protein HBH54_178910 [Parastagonospora nodorum]KAH3950986.1 hypothetical protein HBH53_067120 [Parastagonospora nodorum]KAH3974356.1 hypothetical protein HBH51_091120 [Parastagonospora nodorum]
MCVVTDNNTAVASPYWTPLAVVTAVYALRAHRCSSKCLRVFTCMFSNLQWYGALHPEIERAKADVASSTWETFRDCHWPGGACDGLRRDNLARKVECKGKVVKKRCRTRCPATGGAKARSLALCLSISHHSVYIAPSHPYRNPTPILQHHRELLLSN